MRYEEFLERKLHLGTEDGFAASFVPSWLFPFQSYLAEWSCRMGRSAVFADCGLGKTAIQLVWAENVTRHTGGNVLILTPLAVGQQTVLEAEKFGLRAARSTDGSIPAPITVTNYERLHYFDPDQFVGVVCDESSILKNFDGATRSSVTSFMRKRPYRLLCTATAAPNDYTELGTSSEALGHLGHMDMLNRFFRNEQNNTSGRRMYGKAAMWRFKGHAEEHFWRWVCSWARSLRSPSDLGFEDNGFRLPRLIEQETVVDVNRPLPGELFVRPAITLPEQREERRMTLHERCQIVAEKVNHRTDPAVVWCHLNDESKLLASLIPDAEEVSGADSDDEKERKLKAFSQGQSRVLITKPKIGAFGLNWQHCAYMTVFPSHSFEQYYQAVRRCWRFGQARDVVVDVVTTRGESRVLENLQRKSAAASKMFDSLVHHMNDPMWIHRTNPHTKTTEVPSWL